jgi:hypothetical protein
MAPVAFVSLRDGTEPDGVDAPNVVVVGVAEGVPDVTAARFDVLLTSVVDAPAPWTTCASIDGTITAVENAVAASPDAAVALVHVLRASEGLPVDRGLLVESMAYSMLQHGSTFRRWLEQRHAPPPHDDTEPLKLDRTDDRLDIVLNRPGVRNAFNARMRDALCNAFELVDADASIREVHIFGAGASFCSGGDLSEFGLATDAAVAHRIRIERSVGRAIHRSADRVTAHLHGACIGAGIELSAFAARVVADETTQIRLPEVAMGLIPGAGGTVSIPRRIGRHRTAYLALTGATLDAVAAKRWGLVDDLGG